MKRFLCFILLLISLFGKAQGPQQLVTIPVPDTTSIQGWLYLPADYTTAISKTYPVVVFCHGFGENGASGGINVLLNNGIPNLIANGMRPDNITEPNTTNKYSFICIATQNYDWSPNPQQVLATLNWLKANYRINSNRVYINGLSAGGQQAVEAITYSPELSHWFAAATPMSPAPYYNPSDVQIGYAATENIHTWFFDGDNDPPYTANTNWLVSRFGAFIPNNPSPYFWSGGHCCWTTYENITWHSPTTGLSMWEWFLTYQKSPSLPVTFSSLYIFKGFIYWSTATESNNSYFEVERSEDGEHFTPIGRVATQAPNGNSSLNLDYKFELK